MQSTAPGQLTHHYTTASNALYEIAREYYTLGRLADAQDLLETTLQLLETPDATPQQRLTLGLLYGQVCVVKHFLTREQSAENLFSTILSAKRLAEAVSDQQGIADATSLLGQAHYFATIVEHLKRGIPLTSTPGDGKYDQALAYQQQALGLREALHDMRGASESHFQIGVIYERWQQHTQALEQYLIARRIADQYGYAFEKTEPARHVAVQALIKGDLKQALVLAHEALLLREQARFRPYLPFDHLLLRDIYLASGDQTSAAYHTQQAHALAEEMGLQALVASMRNIRDALAEQQTPAES